MDRHRPSWDDFLNAHNNQMGRGGRRRESYIALVLDKDQYGLGNRHIGPGDTHSGALELVPQERARLHCQFVQVNRLPGAHDAHKKVRDLVGRHIEGRPHDMKRRAMRLLHDEFTQVRLIDIDPDWISASLSPISSDSMDLPLVMVVTPRFRTRSTMSSRACLWSAAQKTLPPFLITLRSNCSRSAGRFFIACFEYRGPGPAPRPGLSRSTERSAGR